jgi:hypothetical protein
LRISLFRLITGVSLTGRVIFAGPIDTSAACGVSATPSSSASLTVGRGASACSRFRFDLAGFDAGFGAGFGAGGSSSGMTADLRVLVRVVLFGGAGCISSGLGSTSGMAFEARRRPFDALVAAFFAGFGAGSGSTTGAGRSFADFALLVFFGGGAGGVASSSSADCAVFGRFDARVK